MIRVGIVGATGYAGGELVRILMGHKEVEIKWYGSRSYIDKEYASVYQNMFQIVDDICKDDNLKEMAKQVDVIFTATPQGFLAGLLDEEILSQVKVIDLSADFRIKETIPQLDRSRLGLERLLRRTRPALPRPNRPSRRNDVPDVTPPLAPFHQTAQFNV